MRRAAIPAAPARAKIWAKWPSGRRSPAIRRTGGDRASTGPRRGGPGRAPARQCRGARPRSRGPRPPRTGRSRTPPHPPPAAGNGRVCLAGIGASAPRLDGAAPTSPEAGRAWGSAGTTARAPLHRRPAGDACQSMPAAIIPAAYHAPAEGAKRRGRARWHCGGHGTRRSRGGRARACAAPAPPRRTPATRRPTGPSALPHAESAASGCGSNDLGRTPRRVSSRPLRLKAISARACGNRPAPPHRRTRARKGGTGASVHVSRARAIAAPAPAGPGW